MKPAQLERPDTERENWHFKTTGPIARIASPALDGDGGGSRGRTFVRTLKASWLNSTSNFPTTIAAAACHGRLCGSERSERARVRLPGQRGSAGSAPAPQRPPSSTPDVVEEVLCVVAAAAGSHRCLCRQAEERKYELMGGCGQRFLQESEGESAAGQMCTCWMFGPGSKMPTQGSSRGTVNSRREVETL